MIALMALLLTASTSSDPLPLNAKVVAFARSNLGLKVGDGECTALASSALRAAGARDRPPWGDEITRMADLRPGDLLFFENVVLLQRRLRNDGAIIRQTVKTPRHAAIVDRVDPIGKDLQITVLHQNSGFKTTDEEAKKLVQTWTFRLGEKKAGTIRAYRPIAMTTNPSPLSDRTDPSLP